MSHLNTVMILAGGGRHDEITTKELSTSQKTSSSINKNTVSCFVTILACGIKTSHYLFGLRNSDSDLFNRKNIDNFWDGGFFLQKSKS